MAVVDVGTLGRDLAALCSPAMEGRRAGSPGAYRAAAYLARALASCRYRPAGTDGFYQALDVPTTRLDGPACLEVAGRAYRHRRDFGEALHLTAGGTYVAPLAVLRDPLQVGQAEICGRIALVPCRTPGFQIAKAARSASAQGALALLVERGEPDWFGKEVFPGRSRMPVVEVRRSVAAELARHDGSQVRLHLPLLKEIVECRNVLGLLPGAGIGKAVLLAAHYDHLGDDPGGERYPGALDNASGVVAVLAAARALAQRAPLPRDVLVAFLTGEESGFVGAHHLAAQPPLPLGAVINVDVLGWEALLGTLRLGHKCPGDLLADLVTDVLAERGVAAQWATANDDARAFRAAGIPVVGLSQPWPRRARVRLHTPDDRPDAVALPAVASGAEIIVEIVARLAVQA